MMTFDDVCQKLRLNNTPDWGIINADSIRIEEFIDFFYNHHELLDSSIKYEFLELIVASMNSALLKNNTNYDLLLKFINYIKPLLFDAKYSLIISYWISISSMQEFPVGILLQDLIENTTS